MDNVYKCLNGKVTCCLRKIIKVVKCFRISKDSEAFLAWMGRREKGMRRMARGGDDVDDV